MCLLCLFALSEGMSESGTIFMRHQIAAYLVLFIFIFDGCWFPSIQFCSFKFFFFCFLFFVESNDHGNGLHVCIAMIKSNSKEYKEKEKKNKKFVSWFCRSNEWLALQSKMRRAYKQRSNQRGERADRSESESVEKGNNNNKNSTRVLEFN